MERFSITFTGTPEMYSYVLKWFDVHSEKVSSIVLTDTSKMYEESAHFRSLVKAEKKAKDMKLQFINDYNEPKDET